MGEVAGPPPADPGRNVWDRLMPGWHAVHVVLLGLTGVLAVGDGALAGGRWVALLVTLVLLAGWYAAAGVRALNGHSRQHGLVYVAGALPLTLLLFWLVPVGALMLVTLYPHIWALLPFRQAMAATVLVVAGVAAAGVTGGLDLDEILVPAVIGLLVAPLLGAWISRVIQQSHQRAELLAQLAATRAELAAVSHDAGALAERERLSREIHDTIAQGFTSVLMLLQALETELEGDPAEARRHLAKAEQTVREHLAESRSLVALLTPAGLDAASLPEALERLAARFGRELGVAAAVTVTGQPWALPANHEVVLLRVTQEALANVRKHAAASKVDVRLGYAEGRVRLEVRDDGRGFDAAAVPDGGFGLAGMRARVGQVRGTLDVESAPGQGTGVVVELPCPDASDPAAAATTTTPAATPIPPAPGAAAPTAPVTPAG